MELGKNKKLLIAVGLLVLGGGFFYLRNKNKKAKTSNLGGGASTVTLNPTYPSGLNEKDSITLGSIDPSGGVYVLISGKKYPFVSEKANLAFGWTQPKVVSKADFDLIPTGGFVGEDGKVVNQ